jgi:hypothetical protein
MAGALSGNKIIDEIKEELVPLRRRIEGQRELCAAQPKKFTKEDSDAGRDDLGQARLRLGRISGRGRRKAMVNYVQILSNLLALRQENFDASKLRINDLIQRRAMGEHNTIHQLQNYLAGIAPGGLVLRGDGSLDLDKSFVHVDYFSLLHNLTVRNNVQVGVVNRPIDLLAVRVPPELVKPLVKENDIADVVWVSAGPEQQALILAREDRMGQLSFRYIPIKRLTQDESGRLHFEFSPGTPVCRSKSWKTQNWNYLLKDTLRIAKRGSAIGIPTWSGSVRCIGPTTPTV